MKKTDRIKFCPACRSGIWDTCPRCHKPLVDLDVHWDTAETLVPLSILELFREADPTWTRTPPPETIRIINGKPFTNDPVTVRAVDIFLGRNE